MSDRDYLELASYTVFDIEKRRNITEQDKEDGGSRKKN